MTGFCHLMKREHTMNYLLKQIIDLCDDGPLPHEAGSLKEFQRRLDTFDEGMNQIHRLAHELDKVLKGEPHPHYAGTLADLDIDTCAVCGHDLRHELHWTKEQRERPIAPCFIDAENP